MGKFTVIPKNTFDGLQMDAGVLLNRFDPSNPVAPQDEDIICATTGGINASCVPTFSDLGEDVDNCPVNMKELKHLDSWACKMSFTSLGTSPASIRLALGCADIDSNDPTKIIPRKDLEQTDFTDIWWVGDRADGGMVAVQLKNALSTSGFTIQTTKNGKGNVSVELTGHVSINAQSEMPMVFYSTGPAPASIELNTHSATVEVDGEITLKAVTKPADQTVTWASDDTSEATVSNGVVTGVDEGTVTITASITVDGETYTDQCIVTVVAAE